MTITPERNDVNISTLFNWSKQVSIGPITCWMRVIGDADVNRARVYALRMSAEMRKLLRTKDSDERLALIPEKEDLDQDNLLEMLVMSNSRDIIIESIGKVQVPFPKEPVSDAALELQEKYQAEVDAWPAKREAAIKDFVESRLEKLREKFRTYPLDRLYSEFEKARINELCESKMRDAFMDACIMYGTFRDADFKERLFESVEELSNLPTPVKKEFIDEYNTLELNMDDLKK